MENNKQEKLVRDNIAKIASAEKDKRNFRIADDHEMPHLFSQKLKEECAEVCQEIDRSSFEKDKLIEELGDLMEVVDGICAHYGITKEELLLKKNEKKRIKGAFFDKLVLDLRKK